MNSYLRFLVLVFVSFLYFLLVNFIHINYFSYTNIINTLIFDIVFVVLSASIFLIIFSNKYHFINFISILTFSLTSLLYSFLVPVMIDRSISVDMLLTLYELDEFTLQKDQFIDETFTIDVLNKRFKEQSEFGLIFLEEGKVKLTRKGIRIARIYSFIKRVLNISRIDEVK